MLEHGNEVGSRRGLIAAVLVIALLVGAGLLLIRVLGRTGEIQDCVQAGRTNCAPAR